MTSLTQLKQGINRLRTKGGANPESLYNFKNGYLTLAGTSKGRGGTVRSKTLPAGTKGLAVFGEKLVVFHATSSTGSDSTVDVIVLRHPTNGAAALKEIHFGEPFMGYLYVAAEYTDGVIRHFWLQATKTWAASTVYVEGDVVQPTVPNGYAYKAVRLGTPPNTWAASVARALTDVVVPTTPNGYRYTVTAVTGANPSSGLTEPTWPTDVGGTVMEGNNIPADPSSGSSGGSTGDSSTGGGTSGGGSVNLPPEVIDRYELNEPEVR